MPDELTYRLGSNAHLEPMADCVLLFSERDQQIHRLNETSAVIADRLEAGATSDELAGELTSRGVEPHTAASWVDAFLDQLSDFALLEADVSNPQMQTVATQHLCLAGVNLSLDYGSDELFQRVAGAFAHLEGPPRPASTTYKLSQTQGLVLIGKGDAPASVFRPEMAAVRLKGLVLDEVLRSDLHLAALHAACVLKHDRGIMLLGSPGAGKTTLALALLNQGYRYGSDDVTVLTRNGLAWGVSLAPAVKESAWEVAETLGTSLSDLPIHNRPDGQRVRFPQLDGSRLAGPCPVRAIVRLHRTGDPEPTLNPICSEDALGALLSESLSNDGRCSGEIMHWLARLVRDADCFALSYCEAADAARLLTANDLD